MNKPNVSISVDGVEYEIGKEHEFSDDGFINHIVKDVLDGYDRGHRTDKPLLGVEDRYWHIRPIQQKELSAEELWRASKDREFLLEEIDSYCTINGCCDKENVLYSHDTIIKPKEVTHFRTAYANVPWRPISEIREYMEVSQ